jgi:hypothetical protein
MKGEAMDANKMRQREREIVCVCVWKKSKALGEFLKLKAVEMGIVTSSGTLSEELECKWAHRVESCLPQHAACIT